MDPHRAGAMAVDDEHIKDKAPETPPASDSHEMALILLPHQSPSLVDSGTGHHHDREPDSSAMDIIIVVDHEGLAIVVHQQQSSVAALDDDDSDGEFQFVPLRTVRPESPENGQEERTGFPYKQGAEKTRPCIIKTYTRRRGMPAGFKSAKSKTEQKTALFDSTGGSSSYSKGDKDEDFEPPTPTRKRGRPAGSKSAKRKTEQKPMSIDSSSSSEGKEDKHDDDYEPEVYDADDYGWKKYARVKGTARRRAVEVNEKLSAEGPSFVKRMLKSHVIKGFWLGLPAMFCRKHLPENDVDIVLEDEEGNICDTKYLAYKMGLSGGWNGFVKQQHLKVGDDVVFQLVTPTRFKVYILRGNKLTTTDGVLGLQSMDTSKENNTSKKKEESSDKDTMSKEDEPEVVTGVRSEEAADGGIRSPGPNTGDFVAVKRLVDFKIVVGDGSVVGRGLLPDGLRKTYYNLCHARKAFLHRNVLKQISPMLAALMITETANIAEGIRASSHASLEDLAVWKMTLESFELMGMDVTFMCKRVNDLLRLDAPSSTSSVEQRPEGYEKVKLERAHVAKQVRAIQSRVSILKDALKEMDAKMKEMVEASAKKDQAVRKLATAPW